jgi:hypothetical protein
LLEICIIGDSTFLMISSSLPPLGESTGFALHGYSQRLSQSVPVQLPSCLRIWQPCPRRIRRRRRRRSVVERG